MKKTSVDNPYSNTRAKSLINNKIYNELIGARGTKWIEKWQIAL